MQTKILIAYYSQSGNTRRIAELIQHQTAGELYEIIPVKVYKSLYLGGGTRIKKERETGTLPELKLPLPNLAEYDVVFLGTPNWGNSLSHPVRAFLTQCNLAGKTVFPFCTHGGGGAGHIAGDMKKLCPDAMVQEIFEIYGDNSLTAKQTIQKWIGGRI